MPKKGKCHVRTHARHSCIVPRPEEIGGQRKVGKYDTGVLFCLVIIIDFRYFTFSALPGKDRSIHWILTRKLYDGISLNCQNNM